MIGVNYPGIEKDECKRRKGKAVDFLQLIFKRRSLLCIKFFSYFGLIGFTKELGSLTAG